MLFDYNLISRSFTYDSYKQFVTQLVKTGKTSGPYQSEGLVRNTEMGMRRLLRGERQFKLVPALKNQLGSFKIHVKWILLVESWCGDGSQNLPAIAGISDAACNIDLRIILRDENPGIMDQFLTNGGRAIPKLIVIHADTQLVMDTWGPRPVPLQERVRELKHRDPENFPDKKGKMIHHWYAMDKGQTIQQELARKIEIWNYHLNSPGSEFQDDYGKYPEFSEFVHPKQTLSSS